MQKIIKHKDVPAYMKESYERLEFLGDSVLSLVVATYLFQEYKNEDEGNENERSADGVHDPDWGCHP